MLLGCESAVRPCLAGETDGLSCGHHSLPSPSDAPQATGHDRMNQPCSERPVIEITDSPKSSDNEGCGWMKAATSSTVASQLTAK